MFKSNAGGNQFFSLTADALAAFVGNTGGPDAVVSSLSNTTDVTLTAAQVQPGGVGSVFVKMTGTLAAGHALTLPTVAVLVAALGSAFIPGMSWRLRVQNESGAAFAWTLTTASGWGAISNGAVSQNTWRDFVLTLTSATAGTVVDVGAGTSP